MDKQINVKIDLTDALEMGAFFEGVLSEISPLMQSGPADLLRLNRVLNVRNIIHAAILEQSNLTELSQAVKENQELDET